MRMRRIISAEFRPAGYRDRGSKVLNPAHFRWCALFRSTCLSYQLENGVDISLAPVLEVRNVKRF